MIEQLIQDVIDGNECPLKAYAIIKQKQKEEDERFKAALNEIQDHAIEESDKYGKSFELHGFKFERRAGSSRYSFKHIPAWQEAERRKKEVEARAKAAFNAYKLGGDMISEDGEVVELPEVTVGKDVLIIK